MDGLRLMPYVEILNALAGSEAPAFKREEAELEKPFFIEFMAQASH